MGYELHITRAEHWTDSLEAPIDRSTWQALALGRLSPAGEVSFKGRPDEPVFLLGGPESPSLYWYDGRVEVTGATSQEELRRVVDLARMLDARVVGDDGELYPTTDHAAPGLLSSIRRWLRRRGS